MGARVGGADERGFCTKEGSWPGKLFISGLPVSGNGGGHRVAGSCPRC